MKGFRTEARVYCSHVAALLVPGRKVEAHTVLSGLMTAVGTLEGWNDDELTLLIEESRRALDSQHARFDQVRTTAQVVLPLSTALLVVFGAGMSFIADERTAVLRYAMYVFWLVGSALVLLAGLGAAATLSVKSDFGTILPTVLSQLDSPVRKTLAQSYAGQVIVGETTIGTRITVIRDSVTLLALGGLVQLLLWIIRTF